jgi:hypothetical protein
MSPVRTWRATWWPFRAAGVIAAVAGVFYGLTYLCGWIATLDTTQPGTEGWRWSLFAASMLSYLAFWCLVWVAAVVVLAALVVRTARFAWRVGAGRLG